MIEASRQIQNLYSQPGGVSTVQTRLTVCEDRFLGQAEGASYLPRGPMQEAQAPTQ